MPADGAAATDYANAQDDRPAADKEHVTDALDELRDALDGGFSGVRGRDLGDAKDAIAGLNGAEIDALVADMSDEELETAFDEVGGDDARDNPQSPANASEYGEIPHQLVVDGISASDVNQGLIGDCWYIASIMAVASAGPDLIERAITTNANGSYPVRIFDDG
jgi:hypothetical protein